jgi:hypothetical protein
MKQHLTGKRARYVGAIAAIVAMVTPFAVAPVAQADRWNDLGGMVGQAVTAKPTWQAYCSDTKGGLSPFLSGVLQLVANLLQGHACQNATAKAAVAATSQTSAVQKVQKSSKAKTKKAKTKAKARAHH